MAIKHIYSWTIARVMLVLVLGIIFWSMMTFWAGRIAPWSRLELQWLSDDDYRIVRNRCSLSNLLVGIMYAHHHYTRIAWCVGVRTVSLVALSILLLRLIFDFCESFGTGLLTTILRILGDAGAWSQGVFLITNVMGIDSLFLLHGQLANMLRLCSRHSRWTVPRRL